MKNKLGELIWRKYANSTVRINNQDTEYKEFCKNVEENVKLHCTPETILSHAFGKEIKLCKTGEWGNKIFFSIIEKKSMNNYTVSIYVSETQTDTFTIKAEDLATAQRDAMTEAVEKGYNIDDVIDVVEVEDIQDNVVDDYLENE